MKHSYSFPGTMKLLLLFIVCLAIVCEARRDKRCLQPVEPGKCRAMIRRWAYDSKKNQCKTFFYGGCGGTKNNFEKEEDCKRICVM